MSGNNGIPPGGKDNPNPNLPVTSDLDKEGKGGITLSEEQINQLEVVSAFLTFTQVADFFGMAESTLRRIRAANQAVERAYKKGLATAIVEVGSTLLAKAKSGNIGAICFYLKTRAGWRETEKIELSGSIGRPSNKDIEDSIDLSDATEEELELVARLGLRGKERDADNLH